MTQEEIRKLLKTCELHINQVEDDETALRDLSEVVHKVLTDSTRAVKLNACAVAAWALHIPVWGFAASKLWNWFLAIGPIPTIGVFHAAGIGLALEFIADTTGMTLHTSAELLGQRMSTEEPWMYLRAIGGVDLGIKGGLR